MNSRERLMAMLEGRPVDRPGVNFYEAGGFKVDPTDPDPFNVYNSPSWQPLLELTENETDLIRMRQIKPLPDEEHPSKEFFESKTYFEGHSRITETTLKVAGRTMRQVARRDRDVDTTWFVEHLLKDEDDLKAFLELPDEALAEEPDMERYYSAEREVGDRGIVMVDSEDPLCEAAMLFPMEQFIVIAYSEPDLFHKLLEKFARKLYPRTEKVAKAFPGHLWRLFGPEFATEPYLPPKLFKEFVNVYTGPQVYIIKEHGGYVRIHSHGRIRNVLPHIMEMNIDGLDPIEPPPQGDIELAEVREKYGGRLVLFGNIEISDLENMEPDSFEKLAARSLEEGTRGEGRGFVLMPSSAPYGREIPGQTLANYRTMVRLVKEFGQ